MKRRPAPPVAESRSSRKPSAISRGCWLSALKLPAHQIRADAPMEQYGIDSVMVMELTGLLEQTFGPLSKTLFFEYQDIQSLSRYFVDAHAQRLHSLLEVESESGTTAAITEANTPGAPTQAGNIHTQPRRATAFRPCQRPPTTATDRGVGHRHHRLGRAVSRCEDICRNFWENLRAGRDCITEIPEERWNHDLYFDADRYKPGKTYGKWGGFLDGVDRIRSPVLQHLAARSRADGPAGTPLPAMRL